MNDKKAMKEAMKLAKNKGMQITVLSSLKGGNTQEPKNRLCPGSELQKKFPAFLIGFLKNMCFSSRGGLPFEFYHFLGPNFWVF